MFSGDRIVCGPREQGRWYFYAYDAGTGELLSMSTEHVGSGNLMRRVSGRDMFVTVNEHTSPSDYHLNRVSEDGAITFVGESPYHGDFSVDSDYGFVGDPAMHVVSPDGYLLNFVNEDCVPTGEGCFI